MLPPKQWTVAVQVNGIYLRGKGDTLEVALRDLEYRANVAMELVADDIVEAGR